MSGHGFLGSVFVFALVLILSQCEADDQNSIAANTDAKLTHLLQQATKRNSWQNFQGSWGKRGVDDMEEDKRNWKSFQGSWGKRNPSDLQNEDIVAEETQKRADWTKLHGTWGKRYDALNKEYLRSLLENYNEPLEDEVSMPYKRDWSRFSGSWGKRPYAYRSLSPRSSNTNWSSLRGSWGKRAAGDWSQLHGTWGKRADEE